MAGNLARSNELRIGRGVLLRVVTAAGLVFLFSPLIILIVYSFNASQLVTEWRGFTLRWYGEVWRDRSLWLAVRNSLIIATASTLVSTVLGIMAALGLGKYTFRGRRLFHNLLHIPIILPEIIMGISLLILFVLIRMPLGFVSVICAHITFSFSFVALIVLAKVQTLDRSLEEASMDLGADRLQTFRYVLLPALLPGIVSGALFAFTISLDDFVVTYFTAGVTSTTLPLKIYSLVKYGVTPAVNAVSTILIAFTTLVLTSITLMQEEGRARRVGTVLGIVIAAGLLSLLGYSVVGQGQTREMTIASWAEYLEGSIVRDFERESKVKVNLTYYNDNEELLAKMQTGHPGYDLVVPTGYMVEIMRKEGLLRQFTPEEIPNARHLDPRFRRLFYDPSGAYYVPYAYGVSGIGYNSDVLKGPVESWLALWDERRRGRILMLDDMMEVFDVGCRVLGYRLNDRNPRQLKEALELLRRQKPLLRKYENTLTKELLAAGEVDIAHTWSGTLLKLALEHPQFKFVVPKEGVLLFVDNLCIPKDAPNPDLAQRFVDYLLQPEMSARNIRTILYAMPNPEAQALLDKGLRENPMLFPPVEDLSRYDITRDLGEYMAEIQRSWTELKSE